MARLIDAFEQFFDSAGNPLVSGKLDFFESGSSTIRKDTYADSAETIPNANPVILNGDGRAPNVFGTGSYRVILSDADSVQILSRDPVGGDVGITFGADWNSSQIYSETDVVRDAGTYWISLLSNNIGNNPSLDGGTNWRIWPDGEDLGDGTVTVDKLAPDVTKLIAEYSSSGQSYTDSGAADAYVLSTVGGKQSLTAYGEGQRFSFLPSADNTGAATANISGLGVIDIKFVGGAEDPSAGDISTEGETTLVYRVSPSPHLEMQGAPPNNSVGSATFTNATNNIALTGIGLIDGLEIGDVIQVSGSSSNDTQLTVEVITDDDNVIVNQAHAGGSTTKSLTNETSSVTVSILSKWYNAPSGLGQGWVDMTSSRSLTTNYTNNTGREFETIISVDGGVVGVGEILVDGNAIIEANIENNLVSPATFGVPAGSVYRMNGEAITLWSEKR